MGLLDTVVDIFLNGPQTWESRVKSGLKLKSPKGQKFEAKWIKDTKTKEKNVAMYSKPFVSGTIARDLGSKGMRYSIPLYFDGDNCDLVSNAVIAALDEKGPWEIDHPVFGFYKLQPLSMTCEYDPINAGGVAVIDSEWIEPLDPSELKTARQLAGIVDSLSEDLNTSALQNAIDNLNTATEVYKSSLKRATDGIQRVVEFALSPLAAGIDTIDSIFWSTMGAIDDLQLATTFQVEQIVGQLQDLIQVATFASEDPHSRFDTYTELGTSLNALLPGSENSSLMDNDISINAKNHAVLIETALLATVSALGQIAITTPIKKIDRDTGNIIGYTNRSQIVSFINNISDMFDEMTNALDGVQENTEDNAYDDQYFSQSGSYHKSYILVSSIINYLLSVAYNLTTEVKYILPRPMSSLEVAVTQYKGFGDNDFNIDLLIASNNLEGQDILLMPAGTEVLIYV